MAVLSKKRKNHNMMKPSFKPPAVGQGSLLRAACAALAIASPFPAVFGSSHMDAPLITLDPAANTSDVYAFVSEHDGQKYLTAALAVYPFQEPGIGPNLYQFDPNVVYVIHVERDGLTTSYAFRFETTYQNQAIIAPTFLPPGVEEAGDAGQNLQQRYSVMSIDTPQRREIRIDPNFRARGRGQTLVGSGLLVPPNNQGLVTRFYNQGDDGENPAKEGAATHDDLDRYTRAGIHEVRGHRVFAGQRDDGFYGDIQSIFDLDFSFGGPNKPFDSQGGFNVKTIVIEIPVDVIGGEDQVIGVWASTMRAQGVVLTPRPREGRPLQRDRGRLVQVGRQGNPLFNEAFVHVERKDLFNRTTPNEDDRLFRRYAENPDLALLLGLPEDLQSNRTDLAAIFIPDVIKVDLSTPPARLAGGTGNGAAPDDQGFHRLSVFAGDVLPSTVENNPLRDENGMVPGGWPNGRRFGDDVIDIAVLALVQSDPTTDANLDGVPGNNIGYNKVFPYAATPSNGRNHRHHRVAGGDTGSE